MSAINDRIRRVPTRKAAVFYFITGVALLIVAYWMSCESRTPSGIENPTVASLEVNPATVALAVGGQQKVAASVFDAAGNALSGYQVGWTSDTPGVASVAADGTITAVGPGTARVTASTQGKQATVLVTVTSPTGGGGGSGGGGTDLIVVNPATRYQTITGWEASAQTGYENPDYLQYRDQLFDQAVNDLGITRMRLPVYSGAENTQDYYTQWRKKQISDSTWRCVRYATVNDNSDPNTTNLAGFQFSQIDTVVEEVILPMQQKMAQSGQKLWVNLLYVAFTGQICAGQQYNHNNPDEYAEFITTVTQHLKTKYNLVPDSWEVILEPDNTQYWRGKTIGAAIISTANRLKANGFNPKFITPSTTRSYNAVPYFDDMINNYPGVKPYLLELSYHRYSAVTDAELQTLASRAAANGIQTSMLEHIASGYQDLHKDLEVARITAWEQFALAFGAIDDGSQYYLVNRTSGSPQVVLASRTKFLRQYFKFIRPGAVRIDATSMVSTADPVAFINSDGRYVVVVAATGASSFHVQGLPAGTYGIKYTTSAAYNVDLADVTIGSGQLVPASIPAAGVLTVYRK